MSNGKDMVILLIVKLTKKTCVNVVNTFLSHIKVLEETLM